MAILYSDAEQHAIYRVANAPIREYPYPHIYVEDVFPTDFYAALKASWPHAQAMQTLDELGRVGKGGYPDRFVMPLQKTRVEALPAGPREFWLGFGPRLLGPHFLAAMLDKFRPYVLERFGRVVSDVEFESEALIVRDRTNYAIGPHTDAPHRFMSFLFYCPDDDRLSHLGTSIYVPKDSLFRCAGGPHYPPTQFERVVTMPYRPNTLFAFLKTDRSFHGVEQIMDADVERDVLLYDIRAPQAGTDKIHAQTKEKDESLTGLGLGLRLLRRLRRKH